MSKCIFGSDIPAANRSFTASHVPDQWQIAIIHPAPKVEKSSGTSELLPISILPILSRKVELYIVQCYIYPAFSKPPMEHLLTEQFAPRLTVSATFAIIILLHHVTELLKPIHT